MAPVYADHPFTLIPTPGSKLKEGEKGDAFTEAASDMALVHNMMIRGLNSIYLQAPHVKPQDQPAFLQYILHWHKLLHVHHRGEETDFFPHIEKLTGQPGLMEANVEQHHAFHDGLDGFAAYARACADKKETYDGARVVRMIDGFGEPLSQHLADEIPTIEGLRAYDDKLGNGVLMGMMNDEAQKNMKSLGLASGLVWAFTNLDTHYENDLWSAWPPAPALIKFLCRYVTIWVHSDWWKFSSCDRFGNMRPLYAVPENKSG